ELLTAVPVDLARLPIYVEHGPRLRVVNEDRVAGEVEDRPVALPRNAQLLLHLPLLCHILVDEDHLPYATPAVADGEEEGLNPTGTGRLGCLRHPRRVEKDRGQIDHLA